MDSATPDVKIAELRKNSRETLLVTLRSFKGHRNVDVRVYAENGKGEPLATPKGVSINPVLLSALIQALSDAREQARREGLLE